jgi:D-serine deaminase-like pyridoxal phosphate-dependent protein
MRSSNFIGKHKLELDTPCLVLDKTKLLANLDLMNRLAQAKQVQVRPHAKTHKCTKIA